MGTAMEDSAFPFWSIEEKDDFFRGLKPPQLL